MILDTSPLRDGAWIPLDVSEFDKLSRMIDELEESIDRFIVSMNIAYDRKFHMYIIQQYNEIVSYMDKSSLSDEVKWVFSELIKRIFENM